MSTDDLTTDLDDRQLLLHLLAMFREFDARQREFDSRLREFDSRLRDVSERLQAFETKVEERLYDTRPMWETVQIQIGELREEMQKGFRKLDSKWEMLAREVRDLYADERELERRVGNIETKVS
jgi:hypothetical protein